MRIRMDGGATANGRCEITAANRILSTVSINRPRLPFGTRYRSVHVDLIGPPRKEQRESNRLVSVRIYRGLSKAIAWPIRFFVPDLSVAR